MKTVYYVCNGARLECSEGSIPSFLRVVRPGVSLCGQAMANIMDHTPVNITPIPPPFGLCISKLNPTVTSTPAGQAPCTPVTPLLWTGGQTNVSVEGYEALLDTSECKCSLGGTIKITNPGQSVVSCDVQDSPKTGTSTIKAIETETATPGSTNGSVVVAEDKVSSSNDDNPPDDSKKEPIAEPHAPNEETKDLVAKCSFCKLPTIINNGCQYAGIERGHRITAIEYDEAARKLGVEIEVLKAIGKKEARGECFNGKGQAKILFERHKMYQHLKKKKYSEDQLNKLIEKYPSIVNTVYGDYNVLSSYDKLKIAKTIDFDSAIKSCSWGCFQVLGEYYQWLYSSPMELELAMNTCELQQFHYFIAYLEKSSPHMIPALQKKDWRKIAFLYNGSKWESQNPTYAKDLEKYYNELKK